MSKSLSGKKISREEALEGLGDPSTWEAHKEAVMKKFREKPKVKVKKNEKDT